MYEKKHKKKVKQIRRGLKSFTPEKTLKIIQRQGEQEDCGTHSVRGGTAVMTQAFCWAFQPRSRWSWDDLD
jgi:hypothetical protein